VPILKSGSLNLLGPSGPVQACNGIALPLLEGRSVSATRYELNLQHLHVLNACKGLTAPTSRNVSPAEFNLYSATNRRLFCRTYPRTVLTSARCIFSQLPIISGVPRGVGLGGSTPPHLPPKFRSFDKAEPNSQFEKNTFVAT
jgi:hypothetical protein